MSESKEGEARVPGVLDRLHGRMELLATILLAVAAVLTAWSSYQSARWSGVQASNYAKAGATRVESGKASTLAGQQTEVDVITFTSWADAYATGDKFLSGFYRERFRPEFKPAVNAWVATRPLKNPKAPRTPFVMPQYKSAATAESDALVQEAEVHTASANQANQRADNYVLAVVMFAAALFFAGISTKLTRPKQRMSILGLGYLLFLSTFIWVLTFPVSISV